MPVARNIYNPRRFSQQKLTHNQVCEQKWSYVPGRELSLNTVTGSRIVTRHDSSVVNKYIDISYVVQTINRVSYFTNRGEGFKIET